MKIYSDARLEKNEVEKIIDFEIKESAKQHAEIAKISLELAGNDILIEKTHKSPIQRVRRITGYLSNIENFNDAKKAECQDRFVHVKN